MGKLDGKVVIITGASRGLGKGFAKHFALEGAKVAVAARTIETLKSGLPGTIGQTVDEIKADGGIAIPVQANVMVEEEVQAMVKKVLDEWGQIDILINNAGVGAPAPIWEMQLKHWNIVIGVMLTGTFLCTKHVLPTMIKQKSGSIINISSVGADTGYVGGRTGAAYGVAKRAIEKFTITCAAEVSKFNIAVNCVKPRRGVLTEGVVFANEQFKKLGGTPPDLSGTGGPETMATAALFFALQDAKGCTAQIAYDDEVVAWHGLEVLKPLKHWITLDND